MKIYKFVCLIVSVFMLTACFEPKIDTSSKESMDKSFEDVRNSMPQEQREKLDEAFQALAFSHVDFANLLSEKNSGNGISAEDKMKMALNGKTGAEILEEGEKIIAERKAKQKVQAMGEIDELNKKKEIADIAKTELSKFQVTRSRFYKREEQFGSPQPIIEITLKNGTAAAVSRAYFEGTIASPDREVPWFKDTFNYSISGGIEPGEEKSVTLAPNMFLKWGSVNAPEDAIFTVTVEQLDGADEETLFTTKDFTESERNRLSELKNKYNVE
jgi:hypothetical protein